jgi:phosphatidylglycerophosphatase A
MTLCPICRKQVQLNDPYMPFCSDRCRILDLANWADGKYVIPGGSLAAIVIAWPLHEYAGVPPWGFAILALLLLGPAIWAADVTARETGLKDPQIVVVDEVVGQWITLAGASLGTAVFGWRAAIDWNTWIIAFVLFRAFDMWKPPPVRQLEKVPGGAGIVLDDVMAGVYAALVLAAAGWFNR